MSGGIDPAFQNDAASLLAMKRQRQQLLAQQLAQGMALQQRAPMQGYGLGGGIGAGLANLASGLAGGLEARQARQELEKNAGEQADVRQQIAKMLAGGGQQPQPTSQPSSAVSLVASALRPQSSATPQPTYAPPAQPAQQQSPAWMAERAKALTLIGTGDPVLAQQGQALFQQSRAEQQMDFQAQQAQQNRNLQGEQIDQGRYSLQMSPYTGSALRLDKRTGQVVPVTQGAAGKEGEPRVGTKYGDAIQREIQSMQDALDPSKFTGPAAQDYQRLQLGQNLQGVIDQMHKDGVTPQLGQVFAADLQKLISGAAGSEGEVNSLVQRSAGGDIQKLAAWLTGDPTGPAQVGFLSQMQDLLNREHGLASQRIRKTQQQRLPAFANLKDNPRYQAIVDSFLPPEPMQGGNLSLEGPGDGASAPPHGATVTQNGVTYNWNPKTGKYE